jgi:hypothetical protein
MSENIELAVMAIEVVMKLETLRDVQFLIRDKEPNPTHVDNVEYLEALGTFRIGAFYAPC